MKTKAQYKVRNWNAYDAALKQRGSITFWVNEEIIEQWRNQHKTGRKGASNYYSLMDVKLPFVLSNPAKLFKKSTAGF
ncbi:MAG: transposase [Pelatocladus maniniholoensis HA4357-MV3]|uniref:Transposase n=1 Tax=Pelatocladus maniniholoensis HA4357-MV3 TaxID=1117104 RepID=A0A9E3LSP2_9NOST|nr:transposase [Pelatocladus maniniholoensis HA4357-MV3]